MRKIQTPEEAEKKRKRKTAIISLFMLFILVFSTLGYALLSSGRQSSSDQSQNTNPNSLNFQGRDLYFSYSYDEIKEIPVETTHTIQNYVGKPLYVAASSNTQVFNEILSNLGTYTARTQEACYGPCTSNLPEKDCAENLIVWTDNSNNRVYQQDNCIFIEGDLRTVDAFLYNLFRQ